MYYGNGSNTFRGTKRMFSERSIKVNSHFKLDKKVREELNTSQDKISVVSTFDTDHQIVEVVEKHVANLSQCNTYCIGTSLPFWVMLQQTLCISEEAFMANLNNLHRTMVANVHNSPCRNKTEIYCFTLVLDSGIKERVRSLWVW